MPNYISVKSQVSTMCESLKDTVTRLNYIKTELAFEYESYCST